MGKGGHSGKAVEGKPRDEQRLGSPRETTRSVLQTAGKGRRSSQSKVPSSAGSSSSPGGSSEALSRDRAGSFPGSGDPRLALLVEAARRGDLAAWEEIVQLLGGLVWAIVRGEGLGVSDALDVVQTVWLRLVEHLQRLQDPGQLRSWMATVARREARRTRDKVRRVLLVDPVGMPDEVGRSSQLPLRQAPPEPEVEAMTQEATVALLRALSRLVPRQRTLLRLLVAEPELSYEEIAGILDMPVGSIGPTRARALERLAKDPELRALRS
jgi:RNA polymerase sigma factor (sigma-70 family)